MKMNIANDVEFWEKIGLMIAKLRQEKNMSQERLAQKSGVHKSTICRLENGAQAIKLDIYVAIMVALGVSPVTCLASILGEPCSAANDELMNDIASCVAAYFVLKK